MLHGYIFLGKLSQELIQVGLLCVSNFRPWKTRWLPSFLLFGKVKLTLCPLTLLAMGVKTNDYVWGGVFRTPRLFLAFLGLFQDTWNHCWPMNNWRDSSVIIQKKRFEIIFKIGQVIAIFPSETKKFQKFKIFGNTFFELKMAIALSIFKILSSIFLQTSPFLL